MLHIHKKNPSVLKKNSAHVNKINNTIAVVFPFSPKQCLQIHCSLQNSLYKFSFSSWGTKAHQNPWLINCQSKLEGKIHRLWVHDTVDGIRLISTMSHHLRSSVFPADMCSSFSLDVVSSKFKLPRFLHLHW